MEEGIVEPHTNQEPKWVDSKELRRLVKCPESRIMKLRRANLIRYKSVGRFFFYDANQADEIRAIIEAIKRQPRPPAPKKPQQQVTAICPRCGRQHVSRRMWTGRGTPRFFCPKCEFVAASRSSVWQNRASAS